MQKKGANTDNAAWVSAEIHFKTRMKLIRVRPHGTCLSAAPYGSWHAIFVRDSAPRAGSHIFDEPGMAVKYQPHRKIQQYYRYLGFHTTRGCSRATTYLNCGSTMHSEVDFKATTKCRNCGSNHHSYSRDCLARPTRAGLTAEEGFGFIRQASQRELAATAARAKTDGKKAEAGSQSASKETMMSGGLGFEALNPEIQARSARSTSKKSVMT